MSKKNETIIEMRINQISFEIKSIQLNLIKLNERSSQSNIIFKQIKFHWIKWEIKPSKSQVSQLRQPVFTGRHGSARVGALWLLFQSSQLEELNPSKLIISYRLAAKQRQHLLLRAQSVIKSYENILRARLINYPLLIDFICFVGGRGGGGVDW